MATETLIFALDDDEFVLDIVRDALSHLGTVKATTLWSEISVPLMRSVHSDAKVVLVCDLQMPGISGEAFCKIARRYAPACKIVVFSAAARECRLAEDGTADAVVAKQDGPEALVSTVRHLLGF